jgi:hypothetical protein
MDVERPRGCAVGARANICYRSFATGLIRLEMCLTCEITQDLESDSV